MIQGSGRTRRRGAPAPLLAVLLGSAAVLAAPGPAFGAAGGERATTSVRFERQVVNLEYSSFELVPSPRPKTRRPEGVGGLVYGTIPRRLPGDDTRTSAHFVLFAARYEGGVAVEAWLDADANDDLRDDPRPVLRGVAGSPRARSFLATLRWSARAGWRPVAVERIVRVVLEGAGESGAPPLARVQHVHAMLGSVEVDGVERAAVLFDGSSDGLFGAEFGDGVYVDLDGDRHFEIDPMSPGFLPLAVPFTLGTRRLRASAIDPEGRSIALEELGPGPPAGELSPGRPAPDFEYRPVTGPAGRLSDQRGRWVVLYFWASWCPSCEAQAPAVRSLHERWGPRGVVTWGVSYDTERARLDSFLKRHGDPWPTTFSGRMLWEDPIGRLYRASGAGIFYVIDPDGIFDGVYSTPADVEARLSAAASGPVGVRLDGVGSRP